MKRILCLFLMICILLAFPACAQKEDVFNIDDVTFEKMPVVLSEAQNSIGSPYGLNKDLEVAEVNGTTYAFEPKIPKADREDCIQTTEAILNRIGTDQKIQINIYALGTYDGTFIKDGAVFTYLQDWRSTEYVMALLYGLFGEYCNYGTIHGYANYLRNAVYDLSLTVCDADWKFDGDTNLLDLNLLCFHAGFFTGIEIKTAKKISNTFVSDYISKNGEAAFRELLVKSGSLEETTAFTQALSDFYSVLGIDYIPSDILYRLGGRTYDYIVRSEYAVMYIERDWYDANMDLCPLTYEGFLHQNYTDTKQYFSTVIKEMGQYQALFALESYQNDLDIYFTNHYKGNGSYYIPGTHSVSIVNTAAFATCYIKAMTIQSAIQENWIVGFIQYFGYKYNYYGTAMWNYETNMPSTGKALEYVREFRAKLGRDIDMMVDFHELQHVGAYSRSYDDPNDGNAYAGGSFVAYLVSKFGEEKVIEIICKTHDFGEYTYEALVAEWQAFLQENYSDYSKYK